MVDTLRSTFLDKTDLPKEDVEVFAEQFIQFRELMMLNNCAIRTVETKLKILNDELFIRNNKTPIEFMKSRVKTLDSIFEKLNRKGLPATLESMEKNLNDIAGVRVVCTFIDDIYRIAAMLEQQNDITVLEKRDYIASPKSNGYRSLHLIVEVPVFLSDKCKNIKVEIQIRTIAMDFWASLEHQLKYKNENEHAEMLQSELKDCAEVIADTDERMQQIKERIDKLNKTKESGETIKDNDGPTLANNSSGKVLMKRMEAASAFAAAGA